MLRTTAFLRGLERARYPPRKRHFIMFVRGTPCSFCICVIQVVKERHKAATRNGVPQGVFSYLSLMLLWLRDIIYIRPQGLFFLCEMVLLDVRYVFYIQYESILRILCTYILYGISINDMYRLYANCAMYIFYDISVRYILVIRQSNDIDVDRRYYVFR